MSIEGTVYERFALALADMGPIAKAQRNAHHGYQYRGIDDVMDAIHTVLAKHGLFYVPRCVGESYEEWKTSKGGRLQVARLSYEFIFYAPDGTTLTVGPVVGQSADTDDKAPMQALSQAAKPALLHAFCVPTSEAKDGDAASPVTAAGGRPNEDPPDEITQEQVDDLKTLKAKVGDEAEAKVLAWAKVSALEDMTGGQAKAVIEKWRAATEPQDQAA